MVADLPCASEGEWHFSIIFDETNTDYDALELISSPITATACTGWSLDGKDVLMEFPISSFKLRKFSSEITQDTAAEPEEQRRAAPSADFYGWRDHFAYAVMKDGTKIQLLERTNCEPIDLAQVDYVSLPTAPSSPSPRRSETMNHTPCLSLWERWPSEAKTERGNDGA